MLKPGLKSSVIPPIVYSVLLFLMRQNFTASFTTITDQIRETKPRITITTRTKTSIRYAKENDREKRERRKERERKVKGEI